MAVSRASLSGLTSVRAIKFRSALALSAYISGGTVTKSGGFITHSFTIEGSNAFTVNADNVNVEYLIVGGGGQAGYGGNGMAVGGGGAGGYRWAQSTTLTRGASQILTVGSGGSGNFSSVLASADGGSSVFNGMTAFGGGGGGSTNEGSTGRSGGSGGGGGSAGGGGPGTTPAGGSGTAGQGNNGGSGRSWNRYPNQPLYYSSGGGGGGYAGSGVAFVGTQQEQVAGGAGGGGTTNNIRGDNALYSRGGTGAGTPSDSNVSNGASPMPANTGFGGWGGAGNGGSGIVVFKYLEPT